MSAKRRGRPYAMGAPMLWCLLAAGCGGEKAADSWVIVRVASAAPVHDIDKRISQPIAKALHDVSGVDYVLSESVSGASIHLVPCRADSSTAKRIRSSLLSVKLPELAEPPTLHHVRSIHPAWWLVMPADQLTEHSLRDIHLLGQRLTWVPGVNNVVAIGMPRREIVVQVDSGRLLAYGLSLERIVMALRTALADRRSPNAAGEPGFGSGALFDARQLEDVAVDRGDSPILLRDVAAVMEMYSRSDAAWSDGMPVIAIGVYPGVNTEKDKLEQGLHNVLDQLQMDVPIRMLPSGAGNYAGEDYAQRVIIQLAFDGALARDAREEVARELSQRLQIAPGSVSLARVAEHDSFLLGTSAVYVFHNLPERRNQQLIQSSRTSLPGRLADQNWQTTLEAELSWQLTDAVNALPGVTANARLESGQGLAAQIALVGPDPTMLERWASETGASLGRSAGVAAVASFGSADRPELHVDLNRQAAGPLGVTQADVRTAVQAATDGIELGAITIHGEELPIRLRYQVEQNSIDNLADLPILTPGGQLIRLRQVGEIQVRSAPASIRRLNGMPMVEISAMPTPVSDVDATGKRLLQVADELRAELKLTGEYQARLLPR